MRDINDYEKKYIAEENDFEVYQALYRKRRVLESLQKAPEQGTVLEIGCGMESVFHYFNNYRQFICIEPSEQFYRIALEQRENNNKILLINDFFENVIFQIKYMDIDYVICSGLLHEIENPHEFLKLIKEIARQDTIIHLNVPNARSFHRLLAKSSGMINDIHEMSGNNICLQQHTVFDLDGLCKLISSVGDVEILEKGSYFVKPFTHKQMKACLDNGIIDEEVLDGFYHMVKYMPDMGSEIFIDFRWR